MEAPADGREKEREREREKEREREREREEFPLILLVQVVRLGTSAFVSLRFVFLKPIFCFFALGSKEIREQVNLE